MDLHRLLEGDIGHCCIPTLSHDVRSGVAVRDRNGGVAEGLRTADVHLMVVGQDHVFHGNVVTSSELFLQPFLTATRTGAIDHDDALVGDHEDIRLIPTTKYALCELHDRIGFSPTPLGGSVSGEQTHDKR